MRFQQWFRPPRHLLGLFLGIALVLSSALGWLSWRLFEQDRELENQRIQERLDHAADLIAATLLRSLTAAEEQLAGQPTDRIQEDSVLAVLTARTVEAYPRSRLLYYPVVAVGKEPPSDAFAEGEALEFQRQDYAGAVAVFRELARSKDSALRAGALLRLGRNLHKANQAAAALAAYQELAALGATSVEGLPAELLARHSRCALLEELKRQPELEREARASYLDLIGGRWPLTGAAYRFYAQEARRWFLPDPGLAPREQAGRALSAAVESLWEDWQRIRRGEGRLSGRRSIWVQDRSVLLLWRGTTERLVALAAGPRYWERQWKIALQPLAERQNVRWALSDAEGHRLAGDVPDPATRQAVRTSSETQLPWTLRVSSADPRAELAQLAGRRRLLLAGLALMALLALAGAYFTARAATRELEVARLQSDFVAAVSHEFRTPLASLRQIGELLADGRVPNEARRHDYYETIQRESARLHRLVEDLLDFGRMEAGAQEYRLRPVEAAALVREVAEEFSQEALQRGYRLEIQLPETLPRLRADRAALTRALWNLLDNAVKYSPECKTVWMEAAWEDSRVAIRVRDHGLGLAPVEQKQIFRKFVRAASAQAAGIKGTGLGLAMVHHIVAAHGGEIRLDSRPGAGSTFTVLLPAEKE